MALAALATILTVVTALPSDRAAATRKVQSLPLPISPSESFVLSNEWEALPSEDTLEALTLKSIEVKSGDNLSLLFKRAGLNDAAMYELLKSSKETQRLKSIFPGHKLEFGLDEQGDLAKLTYLVDKLNSFSFTRDDSGYRFEEHARTPDVRTAQASGQILQSLYTAGIDARLDDRLIMGLAEIFGWDIDFALDIRKGDHFKVVYEEHFLDGEKIGNGAIIAAEFINQGEVFRAVRYENTRGEVGYYTPDGESMRKEFLRAPLDFRRISSSFNPNRLHPILKTSRPHRGIDYAAPTGTPVWSSGSGRVIEAGYSSANGNFVVIQHGGNIQTKYLHLQKRLVKKGDRVKQKQKIGTVGSTGLATGPHLHYEFVVNGVHRNPRTIVARLPKAKSITPAELPRFIFETRSIVAQLDKAFGPHRYAAAENSDDITSL